MMGKLTKRQAERLRKHLRDQGFTQFSSWGRGRDWTTHDSTRRGGYRVQVTKHSSGEYSFRSMLYKKIG